MSIIKAPFTNSQIMKLHLWQQSELLHPFTCSNKKCNRPEHLNNGKLIPNKNGWICPCGKYKQDWCHDFMLET